MVSKSELILVGTHHKTGTVWMSSIFFRIGKLINIPMYNISTGNLGPSKEDKIRVIENAMADNKRAIIYDNHSQFPLDDIKEYPIKGIRVVRNPKSLIVSAAKYHSWSNEKWLHEPMEKFDGVSYQEKFLL